jgi:hypothetical protein
MTQVSWADMSEEPVELVTEIPDQKTLAEQERIRLRKEKRDAKRKKDAERRAFLKSPAIRKGYHKEHEGEWIRVEKNFPKRQKREYFKRKLREYERKQAKMTE